MAIEKAVARVAFLCQIGAAAVVQPRERAAVAAIGKIEKQFAIAAAQVDRLDDVEDSLELDQPLGIPRREL